MPCRAAASRQMSQYACRMLHVHLGGHAVLVVRRIGVVGVGVVGVLGGGLRALQSTRATNALYTGCSSYVHKW